MVKKNCDDMLSRFHLIPESNGQTDTTRDKSVSLDAWRMFFWG